MQSLGRLISVLLRWSQGTRFARLTVILATLSGLLAGLGSTALVAVINAVLGAGLDSSRHHPLAGMFAVLCLLVPLAGFGSQVLLVRLTSRAAKELRLRMARQVLDAPYRLLEDIGAARLLATFTDDIGSVTSAITALPVVLMQLGIMAGCLAYLGWLSRPLLLAVLAFMAFGILTHAVPARKSLGHFRRLREEWDRMFAAFRGLTEGAKELKLNRERRRLFLQEELEPPVEAIRRRAVLANTYALAAGNWGQILFFLFIGLILFASPAVLAIDRASITGYALTILFMITPLTIILNNLPSFSRAFVAAEKVRALGLSLTSSPLEPSARARSPRPWRQLQLLGVRHVYQSEPSSESFAVGPLDLSFYAGQMVFIVGGNGSGKTTLAKLLTGLYEPHAGEIRLDGVPVTSANRDEYRQHFSGIFADYHLFNRLVGPVEERLEVDGRAQLDRLQLGEKVKLVNRRFSTLEVSQGQRKRLALVLATLEDRPIYVFDEWAADQDPSFRQVFYHKLLPELRDRNKTVLVITHDDRYFDVADRVIKLERGRVEWDELVRAPALNSV